jgi:hypothetical protein
MRRGNIVVILAAGIVGYFVPVVLRIVPAFWDLSAWLMIPLCPPLLLSPTVDLSWLAVLVFTAPVNGFIYAGIALAVRSWMLSLRLKKTSHGSSNT